MFDCNSSQTTAARKSNSLLSQLQKSKHQFKLTEKKSFYTLFILTITFLIPTVYLKDKWSFTLAARKSVNVVNKTITFYCKKFSTLSLTKVKLRFSSHSIISNYNLVRHSVYLKQ